MGKRNQAAPAVEAEGEAPAVEEEAAPITRPVGVIELAAALKRYHWHDDTEKTKVAAALLDAFSITVTE